MMPSAIRLMARTRLAREPPDLAVTLADTFVARAIGIVPHVIVGDALAGGRSRLCSHWATACLTVNAQVLVNELVHEL